jgi:2-polyprenyl-3-methyl-5-hydroxy-6-metoxy-1,4-benzoquinol methylase
MQTDGLARLAVPLKHLGDPIQFMLQQCRGFNVLNIGAAGGVERYYQGNLEQWLHHKLASETNSLVGVDIDGDSVSFARRMGTINIVEADCTTMDLGRQFDVIVISEVIEHINCPGLAIQNVLRHLAPDGKILLTTPNPTYAGDLVKAILGMPPSVYYDHVCAFFPENMAALTARLGASIDEAYLFSFTDLRPEYRLKSIVLRSIGRVFPRLHSSFLIVIRKTQ